MLFGWLSLLPVVVVVVNAQQQKKNAVGTNNIIKSTLPKELLECSIIEDVEYKRDPALQLMSYNVGDGIKQTYVYIEPTLKQMYSHHTNDDDSLFPPSYTKIEPKFNGLAGKFINLSKDNVTLIWYVSKKKKPKKMMNKQKHFPEKE